MSLLENDNIRLRALEPEDLEVLYNWENDTELWTFSNSLTPYSRFAIKEFIQNADKDIFTTNQLRLMIHSKHEDVAVGCIDLYDFDVFHQRAAVGILIDEKFRAKGLATEALLLLVGYGFSYLKLKQLYCLIPQDNDASIKLFERAGFKQAGKLLDWIRTMDGFSNVYLYQLINE